MEYKNDPDIDLDCKIFESLNIFSNSYFCFVSSPEKLGKTTCRSRAGAGRLSLRIGITPSLNQALRAMLLMSNAVNTKTTDAFDLL